MYPRFLERAASALIVVVGFAVIFAAGLDAGGAFNGVAEPNVSRIGHSTDAVVAALGALIVATGAIVSALRRIETALKR